MENINYQFIENSFVGITNESNNVVFVGNENHVYQFSFFNKNKMLPIAGFMRVKMK